MAKVYNDNGTLAIAISVWLTDQDKPQERLQLEVSNGISFENYAHLEGYTVRFSGENVCYCCHNQRRYIFDLNDREAWERLTLTRPVKKPRRGKKNGDRYDWEWRDGQWQRFWVD